MIICSPEMNKFILPPYFKLKPFDLKLINTLARNHPFKIQFSCYGNILLIL